MVHFQNWTLCVFTGFYGNDQALGGEKAAAVNM